MDLTDLSDARLGKKNGVTRFTPSQRSARSRARRVLNGKEAAYLSRPEVIAHNNKRQNDWQRAHPEKVSSWYRRWEQKKGPLGILLFRARNNAKAHGRNLEFTIGPEDFETLPTHCPVLGIELDYVGTRGRNPRAMSKMNRASLDRMDSSKGYIPGNVHIISFRANQLKSDGTLDELRALVNWMEKPHEPR